MDTKQKVKFHTLGCKLNFSESSTISKIFTDNNFELIEDKSQIADVIVINTCSVTSLAEKKSRQTISKLIKENPKAFVAAIGCYSELKPEELKNIEGVDLVLGSNEKFKILEYINNLQNDKTPTCDYTKADEFYSSYSLQGRTRTFLKIQDGCDYFCSYCTIPFARGRSRNASVSDIISQINEIVNTGSKEIILTGVNIGDFGKSTHETFTDLVKAIEKLDGINRFRISSIEPNLITDEIIDIISTSNKFLPSFHIPLQSGSDTILKKMNRRYNRDVFKNRLEKIKSCMPHAFIGTDLILGFPGETDELFQETYDFIRDLKLSFIHVFQYSEREKAKASTFSEVVPNTKRYNRSKEIQKLADKKLRQFYSENLGKTASVLFENQHSKGNLYGFTENYIKVEAKYDKRLVNKIVNVKLCELSQNGNVLITFDDLKPFNH
ncbi:MAG TPA: tRNA (N(6)-L-threonylcarbamoyladenosine(37)-C(2))-methylthiotransferase MtaB [Bacteroidales bacterium]|nr:MAG: tRNA (N(6)-L-threonylcarbamoyladenosine(37)-C(2))-methylthiotransferase MtaB [Bacteroidetes bacterium GWF2_33_38]HBF87610.1 tRNA (N(6)-L-threonylcarbamoyladenosine(37)-C(2))-methylthiotransferase MtaB [Bacteroidales bacterium]